MLCVNVVREDFVVVSTSLTSALQKQRDVFADNEDSEKACKDLLESKIDKDVLSLKVDVIKGVSYLTRRDNPCTQTKITKE